MAIDIFTTLEYLYSEYGNVAFVSLPDQIVTCIEQSGITLYKYHKIPEIMRSSHASESAAELISGMQWYALNKYQREFWRKQTQKLLQGDLSTIQCQVRRDLNSGNGGHSAIIEQLRRHRQVEEDEKLATPGIDYASRLKLSKGHLTDVDKEMLDFIGAHSPSPPAAPSSTTFVSTPVLDFFLGESLAGTKPGNLNGSIQTILDTIAVIEQACPSVILRCRSSGMRLWYNPKERDIESIAMRLSSAAQVERDTVDSHAIAQHFETLLRPMVYCNRDLTVFASLSDKVTFSSQDAEALSLDTTSFLEIVNIGSSPQWQACHPFGQTSGTRAVTQLMRAVRHRVQMENPSHILIASRRKRLPPGQQHSEQTREYLDQWGLQSRTTGLSAQLLSCFEDGALSSDEYQDLLEQKLWAFNEHTGRILHRGGMTRADQRG